MAFHETAILALRHRTEEEISLRRIVRDWMRDMGVRYGVPTQSVDDHVANRFGIVADLPDTRRHYWFTYDEYRMGGERALIDWLHAIQDDIRRRLSVVHPRMLHPRVDRDIDRIQPPDLVGFWQWDGPTFNDIKKAGKRAQDLFCKIAGKPAFNLLDSGSPLPIKGSEGTDYLLHNRASYCIERVKDKAKLCAVVPGVPLWDHLLGIKLMVENDEPGFLKVANVARREPDRILMRHAHFGLTSPGL